MDSEWNKRKETADEINNSIDNNSMHKRNRKTQNCTKSYSSNTCHEEEGFENSQNIDSAEFDNITSHESETINMDECLKFFNIKISNGPIYVCTVCLQTWFRRSVSNVEFVKVSSEAEQEKLNQCRRHYVSTEDKEWIHKTC